MKKISEQKLKAFAIGACPLTRKELEKQKKRQDDEATANAFKEYVENFQEAPNALSKVWVKAGTYDAGSRKEDYREKGKLYKPSVRLIEEKSSSDKAQEYAKLLTSESKIEAISLKKRGQEKKKSNLELLKEEFRQIQEEREKRHKYQTIAGQTVSQDTETTKVTSESGLFDFGDPNTTNLYLRNLSPTISGQQLMKLFGPYGPLASIKIMWPRTAEEKSRGTNCGFVAYMSRKDAEKALGELNGFDILGNKMQIGWGKSIQQGTQITKKTSESGSFDNGDPNTTNLYLGNLSPKVNTTYDIYIILFFFL